MENTNFAAAFENASASNEEIKNEPSFTEEELQRIDAYAAELDITDSTSAICFGADAQKRIADFSDTAFLILFSSDFNCKSIRSELSPPLNSLCCS